MSTANLDAADLRAVGRGGLIHEDVMNKIWDISNIPLPFTDLVGTGERASNPYKEWTTDVLAAPDTTNARVDGADASGNNTSTGKRVGNHVQLSDKVVRVSDRAQAVNTIGFANALSYQLERRQKELRRDVEAILLSNQASVADDGNTTAGKVGGFPAWITTNHASGYGFGAGGADGGFSTGTGLVSARTVSTARRALTETFVRDAMEAAYNQGGDPSIMMAIPAVCRKFSEYLFTSSARVATLTSEIDNKRQAAVATGSVNVFVTDFGTLKMVPNRLQPTHNDGSAAVCSDVFLIDPEYVSISYLKGYTTDQLARTGTADNRQMTVHYTLIVNNEAAHALIGDIDSTVAVTG